MRNPLSIVAAGAVLCALVPIPASAAPRTCHGLPVTVAASRGTVVGTAGPDVIRLTAPARVMAGAGNDVICGSPGADRIDAGPGDDTVVARAGDDGVNGGAGTDRLFGEQGRDHLDGGPGRDYLMGGSGRDTVLRGRGRARASNAFVAPWDVVVAGDQGISLTGPPFVIGDGPPPATRVAISWNPAPATVTSTLNTSVPLPGVAATVPLVMATVVVSFSSMVSISPTQGTYVGPVVPASPYAVNGTVGMTGVLPSGSGRALVPQYTEVGAAPVSAGSTTSVLVRPGNWWGAAGHAGQVAVDGYESAQMPVTADVVLDPSLVQFTGYEWQRAAASGPYAITMSPPTSVSVTISPDATAGGFLPANSGQSISVSMNGPVEVHDISWSPATGLRQG